MTDHTTYLLIANLWLALSFLAPSGRAPGKMITIALLWTIAYWATQ